MDNIVEEFSQIKPSMIDKILEYLETGKFEGGGISRHRWEWGVPLHVLQDHHTKLYEFCG